MAFTTTITDQYTRRVITDAYCKASVSLCNTNMTRIEIQVWESAQARTDYPSTPTLQQPIVHVLPTNLDITNINPVDYAYQLLAASGLYPNAVWNV